MEQDKLAFFHRFMFCSKRDKALLSALIKQAKEQGMEAFVGIEKEELFWVSQTIQKTFCKETGITPVFLSKDEMTDESLPSVYRKYQITEQITEKELMQILSDADQDYVYAEDNDLLQMLHEGKLRSFEEMCGHPLLLEGVVVHGKAIGRTVGMPTANLLPLPGQHLPREGVYHTKVHVKGNCYHAVTNIGTRPSVDSDHKFTVESFILDFSDMIYDEKMQIEILDFIRPVQKFHSLAEVQAQVQKDEIFVRETLAFSK